MFSLSLKIVAAWDDQSVKSMRGVRSVSEFKRISQCDHLTLFILSTVNITVNTTMVWGAQPCVGGREGGNGGFNT